MNTEIKLSKRKDNGIYMVAYDGRRISTGERAKSRALVAAKKIIRHGGRRPEKPSGRTLSHALDHTYETVWRHQKGEVGARQRYLAIRDKCGSVPLEEINYAWLLGYVEACKGNSGATINRKLSVISRALKEAQKLEWIHVVPPLPRAREAKGKLRWITKEEQTALKAACPSVFSNPSDADAMADLVDVLCYSGARISELLRALDQRTWSEDRLTFLDTKNSTDRSIPLPPSIASKLSGLALFTHGMNKDGLIRRFTRLRNHVGMRDVSLHTLRHTCASRLVQGGEDLCRVKTWMGHSAVVTTERYAHLAPSSLNSGMAAMEKYL